MEKRSGLSVWMSWGKGEDGASTMPSSSMPTPRSASMSSASSRAASSFTVSGAATPSMNITATRVPDLRPTVLSMSFSFGVHILRRTRAVFVRSVSTKESFAPFSAFSSVGSDMARVFSERTSKHSAVCSVSKITAQCPCVRADTVSSMAVHCLTEQLYTAPHSTAASACASSRALPARALCVRGRSTLDDTSPPETIPSSQHTLSRTFFSRPNAISLTSKSEQLENISRRPSMVSGTLYSGSTSG